MVFELLKKVCNSLDNNNIPYMISGSIAMNFYAIPRMTRDIDLVIELYENQVDLFTSLFPDSYFNRNTILTEIRRKGIFNIIDKESGFKIDFIVRKHTEYFNLAFSRRKYIHEFDTDICIISIEDLIIAKITWIQQLQSERQLSDIRNLLLNPDVDINYVNYWISKLNLKTFNLSIR